jgi:hypothetical protein
MNLILKIAISSALCLTLHACGGGGGSSDSSSNSSSNSSNSSFDGTTFPTELAVVSPTDSAAASSRSARSVSNFSQRTAGDAYSTTVSKIRGVFDGSSSVSTTFTPELFYTQDINANCYGPKLFYDNHVDGTDATPQGSDTLSSLPTGDLGIWKASDDSGQACVAAQLNARMESVKDRSSIALMGIASLIKVYVDSGSTWPTDIAAGATVDLVSNMNALSIANTSFSTATISQDSAGKQWSYSLAFTYTRNSVDYDISVGMTHVQGSSSSEYEGLLTYAADNTFSPAGNCSTNNVTLNGSLHYISNSATDLRFQSRGAQLCNHGSSALTEAVNSTDITGNVVNPTDSTNVWSDNFTQFTAQIDPTTIIGNYSFVWQAGKNDSHSRILNIGLETQSAGEAYFGFGDQVGTTDGSIKGFICNWAGPGGNHTLLDYAQRQHITLNTTSNIFELTNSGASDITFAPTVSCTYDGDGTGTFLYDRDLDDDLSDETTATVNVGTGETLVLDLMEPSGAATNITEQIVSRGYNLPAYPN